MSLTARSIGFQGIGMGPLVYFKSALTRGTDENKVVKVSANDTVALCAEGDDFIGIVRVIDPKDKMAGVQIDGFVEDFPGTHANMPTLGKCCIVAGATPDKVKVLAAAAGHEVYDVVRTSDDTHLVSFNLD